MRSWASCRSPDVGRFIGNGLMFVGGMQMPLAIVLGEIAGMGAEMAAFATGLLLFGGGLVIRRFAGN